MDAATGLKIFHETLPVLAGLIPVAQEALTDLKDGEINFDAVAIVKTLPELVTWEKIQELAGAMLAGAVAEIDGKENTIGETGIGEYTEGDPMEVYTAIFYAMAANYPKYIDPFLTTVAADDSSQDQTKTAAEA
ncbi:MAG: hypothetical protein GY869_28455 [Planctomycetes bacterium]|nr:hypothetical protein [Planctomycetota bacterium]